MRQKLLYFLIILFGVGTLVSGYLWRIENKNKRLKIAEVQNYILKKEIIPEIQKRDETKPNEPPNLQSPISNLQKVPPTSSPPEKNPEKKIEVTVTLEINNTQLLIPYHENLTAEDAMKEAHELYPESFWYEGIEYGGDLGTFVQSINGISENYQEKMHWILYINQKKSNKGISTLKLNQNDIMKWNYEKEIL